MQTAKFLMFVCKYEETANEILNENEDDIFKNDNKKFEVETNLFNFYTVILQIRLDSKHTFI